MKEETIYCAECAVAMSHHENAGHEFEMPASPTPQEPNPKCRHNSKCGPDSAGMYCSEWEINNCDKEPLEEIIEEAMRELVATLHKECLETQLITFEQWNEEIAPKLSQLSNVVRGLKKDSPTARSYRRYADA